MGYRAQRLRATRSPWDITQGRLGTLAVVAADQRSHRRVRTPPQSVCRRGCAGACSAGPHQLRLVGGRDPERDWREHARSPPARVAALCALHLHEALVELALPRERPVRALLVLVDARRLGGKGGMELRQAREHRRQRSWRCGGAVGQKLSCQRLVISFTMFTPHSSYPNTHACRYSSGGVEWRGRGFGRRLVMGRTGNREKSFSSCSSRQNYKSNGSKCNRPVRRIVLPRRPLLQFVEHRLERALRERPSG